MEFITLVVAHKKVKLPELKGYVPIVVGNGNFEIDGAFRDNTGENISERNPNYCELTALYWYWKNKSSYSAVIGLVHYRRYFTTNRWSRDSKWFLSEKELKGCLKNNLIILPEPRIFAHTVEDHYLKFSPGRKKDLDTTRSVMVDLFPEYVTFFDSFLAGNKGSYCNMFYMNKENFENYAEWLFTILFEVDRRTDLSGYSQQEARVFGFLGELLVNVWVKKKRLYDKIFPRSRS